MIDILIIITAYFLGAIPSAYIFTRLFAADDIRSIGTGNVGAGNTCKEIGWIPGSLTLFVDVAKSMLAVYIAMRYGNWFLLPYICAFLVIFGHMYNIFLGFKGGIGLACLAGALIILAPVSLLFLIAIMSIIKAIIKDINTSTALGLLTLPFIIFICEDSWVYFIVATGILLLILTKYIGDCLSFLANRKTSTE